MADAEALKKEKGGDNYNMNVSLTFQKGMVSLQISNLFCNAIFSGVNEDKDAEDSCEMIIIVCVVNIINILIIGL